MKPSILIQTDFSDTWNAVASMKGVMKQVDPQLDIVDLCHYIKNFDPWEASLSLKATEPYWPKGTIFVSVVDPGVGTSRRACAALLKDGSVVITPDNGSLTHLKHKPGIEAIREIDASKWYYHGEEDVAVFHGRDLFGYTAALLSSGMITFEEIGKEYSPNEVVECQEFYYKPLIDEKTVKTWIMTGLRHFGGIELGITNSEFMDWGFKEGDLFEARIYFRENEVFSRNIPFVPSFGFVGEGEPLLYCGSSGYLSIDCNMDNFMERFGINTGKEWTVTLSLLK